MSSAHKALVGISRSELVLRTAKYPKLAPVTKSFDLQPFDSGVQADLDRLLALGERRQSKNGRQLDDVLLRDCAGTAHRIADGVALHILPVHRNLVRHGFMAKQAIAQLSPDVVALPTGPCSLYTLMTQDKRVSEYCKGKKSGDRMAFLAAEKELMDHCLSTPGLSGLVDRRILLRPPPLTLTDSAASTASQEEDMRGYMGGGLLGMSRHRDGGAAERAAASTFSFQSLYLTHFPFFKAGHEARSRKKEVFWAGLPPKLFENRARNRTLAVEWEASILLENYLIGGESGGRFAEWLQAHVAAKKAHLAPQELVSDLNMRFVIKNIARRFGAKKRAGSQGAKDQKRVLLLVPATEYHLAVGWASAVDEITETCVNECCDPSLEVVSNFAKARKDPMFHEVERAVHADTSLRTATSPQAGDDLMLAQDPRLAHPSSPEANPMVQERLRPSSLIKVFDVQPKNIDYSKLSSEEITRDARAALRNDVSRL